MKKLLVALLTILLLVSCSNSKSYPKDSPSEAAIGFVEAILNADQKKMNQYLVASDQIPETKATPEQINSVKKILKAVIGKDYKAQNEKVTGDKASVEVVLLIPDLTEMFPKLMVLGMKINQKYPDYKPELNSMYPIELEADILDLFNTKKRTELVIEVPMVKQADSWKIESMETLGEKIQEKFVEQFGSILQ